jgi:hypothetical protein
MENDYYVLHITEDECVFNGWLLEHRACIHEYLINLTSTFLCCYTHRFAMLWRHEDDR